MPCHLAGHGTLSCNAAKTPFVERVAGAIRRRQFIRANCDAIDTTQLSVRLRFDCRAVRIRPLKACDSLMSLALSTARLRVDYLNDARFLPNPYWQAELRTGRTKQ